MRIRGNELIPLVIFRHGDGTSAEGLHGLIGVVTLASEDASNGIERLLDLADYDRFELATRALEVEVGLVVGSACRKKANQNVLTLCK